MLQLTSTNNSLKDSLQLSDAQSIDMANDMANEFRAKCSNVLFLPEFGLKAAIQHQWYVSSVWFSRAACPQPLVIQ